MFLLVLVVKCFSPSGFSLSFVCSSFSLFSFFRKIEISYRYTEISWCVYVCRGVLICVCVGGWEGFVLVICLGRAAMKSIYVYDSLVVVVVGVVC